MAEELQLPPGYHVGFDAHSGGGKGGYIDGPDDMHDLSNELASANISGGTNNGCDDSKSNLIVNYLPHDIDDETLRGLFKSFGDILVSKVVRDKHSKKSLGYGFVKFVLEEDALKSIEKMNGLQLGHKSLKVSVARPPSLEIRNCKLYVTNLPKDYTEPDVVKLFEEYGEIIECRVLKEKNGQANKGVAFVQFNLKQQANAALALNGYQLDGSNRGLLVKYAQDQHKRKELNRLNNLTANSSHRVMGMQMDGDHNHPMHMKGNNMAYFYHQHHQHHHSQRNLAYGGPGSGMHPHLQHPNSPIGAIYGTMHQSMDYRSKGSSNSRGQGPKLPFPLGTGEMGDQLGQTSWFGQLSPHQLSYLQTHPAGLDSMHGMGISPPPSPGHLPQHVQAHTLAGNHPSHLHLHHHHHHHQQHHHQQHHHQQQQQLHHHHQQHHQQQLLQQQQQQQETEQPEHKKESQQQRSSSPSPSQQNQQQAQEQAQMQQMRQASARPTPTPLQLTTHQVASSPPQSPMSLTSPYSVGAVYLDLKNLPSDSDVDLLYELLTPYGRILDAKVEASSKENEGSTENEDEPSSATKRGKVKMAGFAQAEYAARGLNGAIIYEGATPIEVELTTNASF